MPKKKSKCPLTPFCTTDPLGRCIFCDQDVITHLLIGHGELADEGDLVKSGIEDPDQINCDKTYLDTEVYYKKFDDTTLEKFGGKYIKIPVAISVTKIEGHVKSAFLSDKFHKDESVKWKK